MWSSFVNVFLSIAQMVPFISPLAQPKIQMCTNPVERREWRVLSATERAAWISGIKCLANMPHNSSIIETQFDPTQPRLNPNSSFYDDITFVHNDLIRIIHGTGYFFPWHRHIVHTVEVLMKAHCGYNGAMPYWDWSQDAADFENSSFWKDSDLQSGLGGLGDPNAHMQVRDGGFAGLALAYPYPHLLHRRFSLRPWSNTSIGFHIVPTRMVNETFTPAEVSKVVNGFVGDYHGFQKEIAALPGMHSSVHRIVGGDLAGLCPPGAPEIAPLRSASPPTASEHLRKRSSAHLISFIDPLFFLLHSMLDRVWYQWQNAHPANKNLFKAGSVEHMANTEDFDRYPVGGPPNVNLTTVLPSNGLFGPVTIGDLISTTGGYLCYVYK